MVLPSPLHHWPQAHSLLALPPLDALLSPDPTDADKRVDHQGTPTRPPSA